MNKNKEKEIERICNDIEDNSILACEGMKQLKELFGLGGDRYFITFYTAINKDGFLFLSNIGNRGLQFPSIVGQAQWIGEEYNVQSVAITNIIELSKEDFENAIKK